MTIRARTRIDERGNLSVPVGPSNAGRVVDVTIHLSDATGAAVRHVSEMSSQEYREFLREFVGSSPGFPDADGMLSSDHVTRAAARRA